MKLTHDDMVRLRYAFTADYVTYEGGPSRDERRNIAVANFLIEIYDRGYEEGWRDCEVREGPS